MDTGDHAVQHIALHILGSEPDNLCLISKEGDGGTGSKLHGDCDDQPERKCDADRVAQRLTGTLRFSGTQILSGEGGNLSLIHICVLTLVCICRENRISQVFLFAKMF